MVNIAQQNEGRPQGILGIGAYRPERVVTNDEICERIDSTDEWIRTRTGINTRRFARRDETVMEMSARAAGAAISNANLTGRDIDAVIVATCSHMLLTPAAAVKVATDVGAVGVPAFDITVGCAGFGYAMALASGMVRDRTADHVLVIGAEQLSTTIDMTDRGNCFIFGDGAGAVVVGATEDHQLGPVIWGSDGTQFDAIRQDIDWVTFLDGDDHINRPYLRMEGTSVFRWAAFEMVKVAERALDAAGIDTSELDVFVPHQANARINDLIARGLKLDDSTVIADDIEYMGNTSAASIPLAIDDLLTTGRAKPGDMALLLGYGAGVTYSAQVVRMPPVPRSAVSA